MAIKQYYYQEPAGNYVNMGTGNLAHQAQIEAHSDAHADRHTIDPDTGKKIKKVKKTKKIVAGEYVEIDQEYEVFLVPFEITED